MSKLIDSIAEAKNMTELLDFYYAYHVDAADVAEKAYELGKEQGRIDERNRSNRKSTGRTNSD